MTEPATTPQGWAEHIRHIEVDVIRRAPKDCLICAGIDMHGECEVSWGSHGCDLPSGHHRSDGPDRYCRCECADPDQAGDGAYPYFGPETLLWGSDVQEVWGLNGDAGDDTKPISESPRWQKDRQP